MLISMTGYGRAECDLGNVVYAVEIKSLNSKQLDFTIKIPVILASTPSLKCRIQQGRVGSPSPARRDEDNLEIWISDFCPGAVGYRHEEWRL